MAKWTDPAAALPAERQKVWIRGPGYELRAIYKHERWWTVGGRIFYGRVSGWRPDEPERELVAT